MNVIKVYKKLREAMFKSSSIVKSNKNDFSRSIKYIVMDELMNCKFATTILKARRTSV